MSSYSVRHVVVGIAASLALTAPRLFAQTSSASAEITRNGTVACSDTPTGQTSTVTASCTTVGGIYITNANATAQTGASGGVSTNVWFGGITGSGSITGSSDAQYLQFVQLGGGSLANIFQIAIRGALKIGESAPAGSFADSWGSLAAGFVASGGSLQQTSSATATSTTTLQAMVSGSSLINGLFYFFAQASSDLTVKGPTLGFASTYATIDDPSITIYDAQMRDITANYSMQFQSGGGLPVTSTPEPASLALMATGLSMLGVAGRRRMKLRA